MEEEEEERRNSQPAISVCTHTLAGGTGLHPGKVRVHRQDVPADGVA